MGLCSNPFDCAIDEEIDNIIGHRLYTLGALNEGARVASLGLGIALDIAASLLPGSGIADALKAAGNIASGRGGFFDVLDVVTAGIPAIAAAGKGIKGLRSLLKAKKFQRRSGKFCNSFVAGTMVDVPEPSVDDPSDNDPSNNDPSNNDPSNDDPSDEAKGHTARASMAIESLVEGDEVMTINQQDPSEKARPGTVTRVYRSIAPAILWMTFANGTVLGTTPDHEVWTHEDGWTSAKRVEVGDSFATRDGACVVVTHLRLDPTPTEVFNLEIDGTYTYFVSDVWVHNCPRGPRGKSPGKGGGRRKPDIKEIDGIVKELELSPGQRRILHQEISGQNFSIDEIHAIAEDVRFLYPNK